MTSGSMPSMAASTPTYMMFFSSWRSLGSANFAAAISVSGTGKTVMSSRRRLGGVGRVESYSR